MILSVIPIVKFEVIGSSVDIAITILSTTFMNVWRVRFVFV